MSKFCQIRQWNLVLPLNLVGVMEKKLGDDLIKMHTLLVLKVLVCTVEEWISVDEVETHTNAFTS